MSSEEIQRLRIEIAMLQQERDELRTVNERISEAWCQVVQREQRSDNAHDYDMQQIEAENRRLRQRVNELESRVQQLLTAPHKLCFEDRWKAGWRAGRASLLSVPSSEGERA